MKQSFIFGIDKTVFRRPRRKTLQEALDQASILPFTSSQKRMAARAEKAGKVWGASDISGDGCIFKN